MKRAKRIFMIIIAMGVIALAAAYFLLFSKSSEHPTASNSPHLIQAAKVQAAPIKKETIMETVAAYGTVAPAPGAVEILSVPFESRVRRISVSEGQQISKNDILLEIEPSPSSKLQLEETKTAYKTAKQKLRKVKERFKLKLATREELLAAEDVLQKTRYKLKSLEQNGIRKVRQIRSPASRIVYKIHVNQGSVIPANSPFLEIVPQDRIEAHLGIEQEDVDRLKLGQSVLLSSVNISQAPKVTGQIRFISQSVNPLSRLVDVFVSLPASTRYLLGGYVSGKIVIASKKALVVPRDAVLPEDDHYVLFTVHHGLAIKHIVKPGLEDGKRIEVVDKDLKPGELVVIQGNYELKDGMPVQAQVIK